MGSIDITLNKKEADIEDKIKAADLEDKLNPKKALGDNSVITLRDQEIKETTNKGGIPTVLTPAGIMTTEHNKRGW